MKRAKSLVLGTAFVAVVAAAVVMFFFSGNDANPSRSGKRLDGPGATAERSDAERDHAKRKHEAERVDGGNSKTAAAQNPPSKGALPKPAPEPLAIDGPPPIRERLQKGEQVLKGCILTSGGDPLPKAVVELYQLAGDSPLAPGERVRVAAPLVTDGKGCFSFSTLDGGTGYLLHVDHGSFAPYELGGLEVSIGSPLQVPDIRMTAGAQVVGTVTDENGKPFPSALVSAWTQNGAIDSLRGAPVRQILTDDKGNYALEHLGLGSYQFVIAAAGKRTQRTKQYELASANQLQRIDFKLEPGLVVRGKVINESKEPVANAIVEARPRLGSNSALARTTTRENGIFELTGLGADELRVDARASGYTPQSVVPVQPRDEKPILITMHPTAGISGFVIDKATSKPITSFGILVWTIGKGETLNEKLGDMRVFEKTADGSFTIEDVPPGHYRLQAFANDHGPKFTKTFDVKRMFVNGVTIELDHGSTVAGKAIDGNGKPIAGATIRMFENAYQKGPLSKMLYGEYAEVAQPVTTDAQGNFRFEHQGPQTVQLRASSPGRMPVTLKDVVIAEGADTTVPDLQLSEGAGLRGLISDANGPAKGARVTLIGKDGEMETTKTNADGEYVFEHIAPGEYTLSAEPVHTNAGQTNFLLDAILSGKTAKAVTLVDGSMQRFDLSLVPTK